MVETIAVLAIVGLVLGLAGRSFYRTLTGKNGGCSCGSPSCSAPDRCASAEAAKRKTKESP